MRIIFKMYLLFNFRDQAMDQLRFAFQVGGKMKIAIRTRLFAKWNMNINARQSVALLIFNYSMPVKYFLLFLLMWMMCSVQASAQKNANEFVLKIHGPKDSSFIADGLKLQTVFNSEPAINNYINGLPSLLISKGYPAASVDSIWMNAGVHHIILYTGKYYSRIRLTPVNIEKKALDETGYPVNTFTQKPFNVYQVQTLKEKLLRYYEKNGHPFASVFLDSIRVENEVMIALLKTDLSELYKIDSIRVFGKVQLNKNFLQKYIDIINGSAYNAGKLKDIDKRIGNLPFVSMVQPSDITMLGSGAIINLYLKQRKSSQFNFLVGFLPAANNKVQITGDVNLDLKNTFGGGESFLLKWQQLQVKSPRLNLGFSTPFVFRSRFGFDFVFDLFKKDSSFVQLNAQVGTQYTFSGTRSGKLFLQWQNMSLLPGGIDTNQIKFSKKLPLNIDVSALNAGLSYELNTTNYRFNPKRGNEFFIITTVGLKNIKKNNDIVSIKDPSFNYGSLYDSVSKKLYQLRWRSNFSHYFPSGKSAVFKTTVSAGMFISPEVFRNELFQIGGYKLLRGFDEESIYASQYGVLSLEYRYLVDVNSYLFFFTDAALVQRKYREQNNHNNFFSGGIGIVYETKLGLLNVAYAIGKRNDVKFNLREASKLHFGYISYF